MEEQTRILLIDDDRLLTKALELYLRRVGYEVHIAHDGVQGLKKLHATRPHLVLLDVMMPEMDGFAVCQRARTTSMVPIIMLTARGQEGDRIKGLRLGADDYLAKPFSTKELGARIEAVLRRVRWQMETRRSDDVSKSRLVADDLMIDADRWEVKRAGERLELTPTELKLLFYMAENAGRVLSHRQLLQEVWGPEYSDEFEYTKLFVWRLRQKIEPDPANPKYILTERGIGYRFALSA